MSRRRGYLCQYKLFSSYPFVETYTDFSPIQTDQKDYILFSFHKCIGDIFQCYSSIVFHSSRFAAICTLSTTSGSIKSYKHTPKSLKSSRIPNSYESKPTLFH